MDLPIVVDVWQGNPDIDEGVLHAEGVKMFIPRLNDMNGGHHMDENFVVQWYEAASFLRTPYFVYNPWKNGGENFDWFYNNAPADYPTRFMLDVEVRYEGRTPTEYSQHVFEFIRLARQAGKEPVVYTGKWFLSYLSVWPTNVDYWWARYPYAVYPPERTYISWADLRVKLNGLFWGTGNTPGPCRLWQCTADRYVLPGCGNTCVDINLWNGTEQELADWLGAVIPVPQPTVEERLSRLEAEARSHGWNI